VSLVGDSTLDLTSNLVASVSDPNNDGRLAFENTDHTDGELKQPGSLAGYVTFGFGSPAGALHASLHLTAATSADIGFTLPQGRRDDRCRVARHLHRLADGNADEHRVGRRLLEHVAA
jgi:hypothetical protein